MKQLTLLFLIKDNRMLLAMKKRGFGTGRWNGVGGKLEPNETHEEAAVRECREEIGVTPTQFHKAAEIVFDMEHQGEKTIHNVHVFICTEWQGEPSETEEMLPKWFKQDQPPYDDMWADDRYWLPRILSGELLKCNFTLDHNDQLVSHDIQKVAAL